ncbi:MAG: hypothetical protein NTZ05_16990, partial [Chloroflexi bacterium]|nr:hypothetical protein [Chloroflexota bacterium]
EEAVAEALALSLHLPYIRLGAWPVRPPLVRLIPRAIAEAWEIAPFAIYRGRLLVAISRPEALPALREAARASGFPIAPVAAPRNAIRSALRVAWGSAPDQGTVDPTTLVDTVVASAAGRLPSAGDAPPWASAVRWLRARRRGRRARGRSDLRVDPTVAAWLPSALVVELGGLPLRRQRDNVVLAVKKPLQRPQIESYEALFNAGITELTVEPDDYEGLIQRWFLPPTTPTTVVWPEQWWTSEEPLDGFLLSMGYVTPEQARAVRRRRVERKLNLRTLLLESGALTEEALAEALGLWLGAPWVQVDQWIPEPDVPRLIPTDFARRYGVLPLSLSGSGLLAAAVTPDSRVVIEQLGRDLGMTVRLAVASRSSMARALRRWVSEAGEELSEEFITVAEALVRSGRLTPGERAFLAETHLRSGAQPDEAAVRTGLFSEEDFAATTATALNLPLIDLTPQEQYLPSIDAIGRSVTVRRFVDPVQGGFAHRLTEQEARAAAAIPVRRLGDRIQVAFAWPSTEHVLALEAALGEPIAPAVARRAQIETAIARQLGRPRLGDSLLEAGLVRSDQLEAAAQLGQRTGLRLGEALVSLGFVSETQLAAHLAEQNNLPLFDLQGEVIDPEVGKLVPKAFAGERLVLPISRNDDELVLAIVDPLDRTVISEVELSTGLKVRPVLVTASEFAAAFQELH